MQLGSVSEMVSIKLGDLADDYTSVLILNKENPKELFLYQQGSNHLKKLHQI